MEIARPCSVVSFHLGELLVRVKRGNRSGAPHLERRRRELEQFRIEDHLVDPAPAFFAVAHSSHHRSQVLIPRSGWEIEETHRVYQRFPRIGELDPVGEYLYHWPGAGYAEILMNNHVGGKFAHRDIRMHADFFSWRTADFLKTDQPCSQRCSFACPCSGDDAGWPLSKFKPFSLLFCKISHDLLAVQR